MSSKHFMRGVGVIEMLVGIGILSPRSKVSSYAASAWLFSIAVNLWLNEDYDIAVRDLNMAIAAFVLGRMSDAHAREHEESEIVERQLSAA